MFFGNNTSKYSIASPRYACGKGFWANEAIGKKGYSREAMIKEGCFSDFIDPYFSWARIFEILFSKRCTFGSKSGTKSLVRRYQAKFAKTVPDHLKVAVIFGV